MNRQDIIELARRAGIRVLDDNFQKPDRTEVWATQEEFEYFALLVLDFIQTNGDTK